MPSEEGLSLFEAWLLRFHEGAQDFDAFCAEHPEHERLFRRLWQRLVDSEEISPTGSGLADSAPGSSTALLDSTTGLPEEGSIYGSYRVHHELGRGSQGSVFLAEDTRLGRKVALKILPAWRMHGATLVRRFTREAELASRLDHPGLCTVFERGTEAGTAFLAMRYVEGESLAVRLAREKNGLRDRRQQDGKLGGHALRLPELGTPRDEPEAIRVVLQLFEKIAEALQAAHEAGLIHRDIKPANILVDLEGRPVVLDFGLARQVQDQELTLTGDLVGTPAYMSPEQIAAQRIEVDQRSDLYSLGASLFECLTLRRPFEAATQNELYQQILTAEAPSARRFNPTVSKELATVLATALEKDRGRRYQSARDFAEDLARIRRHEPIRARPASTARQRALQAWLDGPAKRLRAALPDLRERLAVLRRNALPVSNEALTAFRAKLAPSAERRRLEQEILGYRTGLQHSVSLKRDLATDFLRHAIRRHRARIEDCERILATARPWHFATPTEQVAHDSLAPLITAIEAFLAKDGLVDTLSQELAFVQSLASVQQKHQAAWDQAARRVQEDPRFHGLALHAQAGLIPLGPDPRSGLEEFALIRSGNIPERDDDEQLVLTDETALILVLLPGARYVMGSRRRATNPIEQRRPPIQLTSFFVAKHELTWGQWKRLGGPALSPAASAVQLLSRSAAGPRHPMESISWLVTRTHLRRHGLEIPSEAQWEYAARGTRDAPTPWLPGVLDPPPANLRDRSFFASSGRRSSRLYDDGAALTAPVGSYPPNGFGLHDVLGNVAEWCRESYYPVPLEIFARDDGDGFHHVPRSGLRAVRGAGYDAAPSSVYIGARSRRHELVAWRALGVRPVRRLEP